LGHAQEASKRRRSAARARKDRIVVPTSCNNWL
jgi:hypothetical protein